MNHHARAGRPARLDTTTGGFALVVVVFITALLALLAITLTVAVRSHLRLTATAVRAAKAEAAADAGVQLAVLSLVAGSQPRGKRRFPINGQLALCTMSDGTVLALRIQDTSGRVSLNLAGERLLMALFLGLGASTQDASRATDLIIDYRDADPDRRPNGAEAPEYVAANRTGPKNGPFDTVEELSRVLGLDAALSAAAQPFLSAHSQTAGLDLRSITPELTQILLRGFEQLPARAGALSNTTGALPAEFLSGSPERVFTVSSEAHLADGTVFVRQSVLELQATRTSVPVFKSWSRGERGPATAIDPAAPPC